MESERGAHRGRHRLAGRPAPVARAEETTDVLPIIGSLIPPTPATGLAKFDLGSIPASVTPPRTWRHAALFAVVASIMVLVGLAYAAATLVTAPRKPEMVDALPGLPSAALQVETPEQVLSQRPTPSSAKPSPSPTTTTRPSVDKQRLTTPGLTSHAPVRPTTAAPTVTTTTDDGPASRTTVETPVLIGPVADAQIIGDRTETYFRQVTQNPDAAYAMTTGPARYDGQEQIERRYGGITRIEVERMTIDANQSTTLSVLRVTRWDGSVGFEQRELTFTYGSDPKITNDVPA